MEDFQFVARLLAVLEVCRGERARRADLGQQQADAAGLVALAVGGAGHRRFQQFANDALVHLRVLAQIERRQVEAEDARCPPQFSQATACQQ
ncbi:MAG: hypothetical protein AW07_01269 [Candidatus Accumulibacter sp. SK-11]|nr:MAG: hypothetical protein AW07_01269 [Candidatus Accumulibacter sp. SK-11]